MNVINEFKDYIRVISWTECNFFNKYQPFDHHDCFSMRDGLDDILVFSTKSMPCSQIYFPQIYVKDF